MISSKPISLAESGKTADIEFTLPALVAADLSWLPPNTTAAASPVIWITFEAREAWYCDLIMLRLLLALYIFTSIASAQEATVAKSPAASVREEYLRAYNTHNANVVLALYAEDAVLLSEAGVFHGKAEIEKWLQFALDRGSVLDSITPDREESSDTLAYGAGHTRRLAGNEVHLGRYLIVIQLQQGKWRIVEHASFNVKEGALEASE